MRSFTNSNLTDGGTNRDFALVVAQGRWPLTRGGRSGRFHHVIKSFNHSLKDQKVIFPQDSHYATLICANGTSGSSRPHQIKYKGFSSYFRGNHFHTWIFSRLLSTSTQNFGSHTITLPL